MAGSDRAAAPGAEPGVEGLKVTLGANVGQLGEQPLVSSRQMGTMKYLALILTVVLVAACGNRAVNPVSDGDEDLGAVDLASLDAVVKPDKAKPDVAKLKKDAHKPDVALPDQMLPDQKAPDSGSTCKHPKVVKNCMKDSQGITWCTILAGCFQMGSSKSEKCRDSAFVSS